MIEPPLRRIYRRYFKPGPLRKLAAASRALPDFLVIGAMRAGTTTLYDLVCRHPGIVPALRKEVHYYDLFFPLGENWYRAHFPRTDHLRRDGKISGEASPYYIFHPLAPARIAAHLPDAKIIAILREPIARAYSHYWHIVRTGQEKHSFKKALELEDERLAGEAARIRADPAYQSQAHQHFSYRTRSVYADQLAIWLDLFPREQILVLEQQQFYGDSQAGTQRLFDFLGLAPHAVRPPARHNQAAYPPMDPETHAGLQEFFAPHNARLFDLLGERFDWAD